MKAVKLDSIAVPLFGNMTVERGEILIDTKERVSEQKIQIIILLKRGSCLIFGPKTLFLVPFHLFLALFGPFVTLFNTQKPFWAVLQNSI